MKVFFKKLLATGFYTGYFPFGSGTVATLLAVVIFLLLINIPVVFYSLTIILLLYSVSLCDWAEKYFNEKDSSKIVIDEIVGFFITMSGIRLVYPFNDSRSYIILTAGFVLFRIFDIWKPLYINTVQKVKGGLGVMLDDILAGIYANIVLFILIELL